MKLKIYDMYTFRTKYPEILNDHFIDMLYHGKVSTRIARLFKDVDSIYHSLKISMLNYTNIDNLNNIEDLEWLLFSDNETGELYIFPDGSLTILTGKE